MENARADACNEIKGQEFLLAPKIFKNWCGRSEYKHIKKNVKYAGIGMCKHVREELIGPEKIRLRVP